jgi:hypothetical protein
MAFGIILQNTRTAQRLTRRLCRLPEQRLRANRRSI